MKNPVTGIKRYFNINELVFDLAVLIVLGYGIDYILPGGRSLIELYSPGALYGIVLISIFFLMLFLADIYKAYTGNTGNSFLMVLIKIIFFLSVTAIYLVTLTFYSSLHILPWNMPVHREMDMIFLLIPVYPIVWGLTVGFAGDIREVKYTLYVPGMMSFAMIPVYSAIVGYHISWWLALPVFIILIVLLTGPGYAAGRISRSVSGALSSNSGLRVLKTAWGSFMFPVFTALGIILWQKITVEMFYQAYANWKQPPDMGVIFRALIWSGIVPVRILSAMAPPWKLTNTLIGACAVAYYIFYLYKNFHH